MLRVEFYQKGSTIGPNESDMYTATIDVVTYNVTPEKASRDVHWAGIAAHGRNRAEAESRRDLVLAGLPKGE